jgi:FHA domain
MTGARSRGSGEQTQPMACPPWLMETAAGDGPRAASSAPGGRAERGLYADADTVDEPDAGVAGSSGSGPSGSGPSDSGPSGPGPSGPGPSGPGPSGSGPSGSGPSGPGPSGPGPSGPGPSGSGPSGPGHAGADRPPGSGGPLLAWLWGEQGQAGEYLLASHSVTVGRDPGNDIVLADSTVSREHVKIGYCEGQWWLQPADSAGPTWVNGQPVEPGQRLPVTDGDRLRLGFHTQFRLLVPSAR